MSLPGPMLRMVNIGKAFPGVQAVDGVSFELDRGEIHALLGHNGAGKSTLVKIISGAYRQDSGEVYLDGQLVDFTSPRMAIDAGVHMVYQELDLIPHLSGAENIYLGQGLFHNRLGLIDRKAKLLAAKALLGTLDVDIDLARPVGQLGVSMQQIVAIAKAISSNAKVVIFDEPTSALNETESHKLFQIMRLLAKDSVSLILITHRLDEIFGIADRVTVMKDGKHVFVRNIGEVSKADIIRNMTTATDEDLLRRSSRAGSSVHVPALTCEGIGDARTFDGISFTVHKGEIVGITGLIGCGAVEVARAIYGAGFLASGRVTVDGNIVRRNDTSDAVNKGLAFVSDNRKRDGLVLSSSVKHNISLTVLGWLSRFGVVNRSRERAHVKAMMEQLRIKVASPDQRAATLSGGNQQKVVLSKWLLRDSKVLVLCEPTRGIDVATQGEIHSMIVSFAANGLAVLVVSTEIDEIFTLCDRVLVLYEGGVVAEVERSAFQKEEMMSMTYGLT